MDFKKLWNIVSCKCPKCQSGKMFETRGNALLFRIPQMYKHCKHCQFKFEMENGFFFGAMYASYALAVAEMVACFVIFWFMLAWPSWVVLTIIGVMAVLASTFNYRVSRAIWVYIFYKDR